MPSNIFEGGKGSIQAVVALGTGAVATQTKIVCAVPKKAKIKAINLYGQAAVTGTSVTAEVFARTAAGAAGNSLNTAKDIKFASATAAKAGVGATLTTTLANRNLAEGQLLEVVITASAITAGPGDVLVVIEYEARA